MNLCHKCCDQYAVGDYAMTAAIDVNRGKCGKCGEILPVVQIPERLMSSEQNPEECDTNMPNQGENPDNQK